MSLCEICNSEVTKGSAKRVPSAKLLSAVRMGYDLYSGFDPSRSREQRCEDFLLLLEMHDPCWALCHRCCEAVESYAAKECDTGPLAPEAIRIFGNGFLPEPTHWRLILGAWLAKPEHEGIEITIAGTPIEIEQSPHTSFEEFIEIVPSHRRQHPEQVVDDLITRHVEDGMILIAIWSVKDSGTISRGPTKWTA